MIYAKNPKGWLVGILASPALLWLTIVAFLTMSEVSVSIDEPGGE